MIAGHGEGLLSGGNGALAEATAGGTDPAVEAADMDPMEPPPPQALKADSIAIRVLIQPWATTKPSLFGAC
jgi:hypothetical protein